MEYVSKEKLYEAVQEILEKCETADDLFNQQRIMAEIVETMTRSEWLYRRKRGELK